MPRPSRSSFIARVILAIPFFIITILFILAAAKLHKNWVIGVSIIFIFLSMYCLYNFTTALCCGLMNMHRKHKCCRSTYVFCCMCFIRDTECCTAQEDNHCPCFKFCCVDDIEADEASTVHELTDAFKVEDDQPNGARWGDSGTPTTSLLHNSRPASGANDSGNLPPPVYKGSPAPKYEGL